MLPPIPFLSQSGKTEKALWLEALARAMPGERILPFSSLSEAERQAATLAIVANPDPTEIRQFPRLLWVQSLWAGVERLARDMMGHDLTIVRLIDPELSRTMAEAVLAWTLYLHRDMPSYAAHQRKKLWRDLPYRSPAQRRVSLLGLGELGTKAAISLARNGFSVRGWSRTPRQMAEIETFCGRAGLLEMLAQTDILVCLLPLTAQTEGLMGAEALRALPVGASFINFGRGPVVVMADLLALLDNGHLAHAVLDVFEVEPLPVSSPLWLHKSVTILPHISADTNRETASKIAAANVLAYRLQGHIPKGIDRVLGY